MMAKHVVFHYEHKDVELPEAYPYCQCIFNRSGWIQLFAKFQGYNAKVTKEFRETFDGIIAQNTRNKGPTFKSFIGGNHRPT